jgi:rubrerythrin
MLKRGKKTAAAQNEMVLWPSNAAIVARLSQTMKLPPAWIVNRLIELAVNTTFAEGLKRVFEQPLLVAGGVVPDPAAVPADDNGTATGADAAKVEETVSALSADERRHRMKILAGVEEAACRKCGARANVVGEDVETMRFECPTCGEGVKADAVDSGGLADA